MPIYNGTSSADSGIDTVLRSMWNNPQALIHEKVGTSGYTLPDIESLRWHELSSDAQIHENLIVKCSEGNQNNWLLAPEDWVLHQNLTITLYPHAKNNIVVVGRNANIFGAIYLHHFGGLIVIGEDTPHISMFDLRLYHENALIFWGRKSSSNGTYMVLQGASKHIVVGDDCMFANGVYVRNSDMHGIMDIHTGEWINPGGNLLIEPHVWIGQDALILKNTTLGFGSIIGAKSVVSKSVPRYSLAVGSPAKVIREGVVWDREEVPRPEQIEVLKTLERSLI